MTKIIKLTESDLIHIIHKVLSEQSVIGAPNNRVISSNTPKPSPVTPKPSPVTPKPSPVTPKGLECVPKLFSAPVDNLKLKGYNTFFLKAALGVIGRESSFGSGNRFDYLNPLKTLWAKLGGATSVGPGQIKPEAAEKYGMDVDDLNTALGSLTTVYNILIDNFKKARQVGFSGSPSVNVKNGTGNAALDMAIVAYNTGAGKIVKYCETSDPKIKKDCKDAGKVINGITVKNKPVADYIPNFKTNRWDGVEISSHGYIQEVANKMKTYTCFS
jgi:hypothetical protein